MTNPPLSQTAQPMNWYCKYFCSFQIFLSISSLNTVVPWFQALINIIPIILLVNPNPYSLLLCLHSVRPAHLKGWPTSHTHYIQTTIGDLSAFLSNKNVGHCIFHLHLIHLILIYRLVFWELALLKPGLEKLVLAQCVSQARFWILLPESHLLVVDLWRR